MESLVVFIMLIIVLIIVISPFIMIVIGIKYMINRQSNQAKIECDKKKKEEERILKEKEEELIEAAETILIEVEKTQNEILNLYHQECYGGKIEQEDTMFTCQRCKKTFYLPINYQQSFSSIVKTAIDGEKREIIAYDDHSYEHRKKLFKVILNKKKH